MNLSHPRVLQMVTDSLRYWVTEMHVDGFRFDLATILGREPYGFDQGGGFLDSCRQDPVLNSVKLIAEPWDLGPGGYQVGAFPPGWAEWNDRFRDTVRSYWRGDDGRVGDMASRITGSADLFNERGRKPWASVNFVTAHDGFTLDDLVSYHDKHNKANGEDNRDGGLVGAEELPGREEQRSTCTGQDVGGLTGGVSGVQRYHDAAGVVRGQACHHPVPGIRRPDRDAVPGAHAQVDHRGGGLAHLGAQLPVGQLTIVGNQRVVIGQLVGNPVQDLRNGPQIGGHRCSSNKASAW